jgi:hypothetical protein
MGQPRYPTRAQYRRLREAARLPPPFQIPLKAGEVRVTVPESGLALVVLR